MRIATVCDDNWLASGTKLALLLAVLGIATSLFAQTTGSISGTVRDSQGLVVVDATVRVTNTETGVVSNTRSDTAGFFSVPALPVGHYEISFQKTGFSQYRKRGLVINVGSALLVDAVLQVGSVSEVVTVQAAAAQVDTRTVEMGEVIGSKEMVDLPLNGRAYTDLLALQPGVVPMSVSEYGSISPANSLNNGLLSISGGRDMSSGFMVNGANTVDGYGFGTFLVPNLDSISEFKIITSNGGAEYGNYSGGLVNVVTKSGTNAFHGDAFEFWRNAGLDARNYFADSRGVYHQNQFGGTFGGPILKNKLFFFVDYQGTRYKIADDLVAFVPTDAERAGDFSSITGALSGAVSSPYWAGVLSQRLGYPVAAGEPYYTAGCTSSANCVFPNAMIPQSAWSSVTPNVLSLIPHVNGTTDGIPSFKSSAYADTLQDDKGGIRIDWDSRLGRISGYYHIDPWTNPLAFNPGYAGSTVPGFPNVAQGKAQLFTLNLTSVFGPTTTNQFTASYTRNKNIQGLAGNSNKPSLASLGFRDPTQGGPYQESGATYQNWPLIRLNQFSLGAYDILLSQFNNTYEFQDDFTKVIGSHTLKFGGAYHWDQIFYDQPNNASNGGFGFSGAETGLDFADLLIGAPSYFFQGSPVGLSLRNYYVGAYAEDSWRVKPNLTFNYGLRWEVLPFWYDATNHSSVILKGVQSVRFPTAPLGYAFPGDPGVPKRMANTRWDDFSPRIGLAYSPDFSSGVLHTLFGSNGQSSIRVGYGRYFTAIPGANSKNFASPPYALFYFNTNVLLEAPFISRKSGVKATQPFPIPKYPPGSQVDFSRYLPLGGFRNPVPDSPTPYSEHVDVSFQRQLTSKTVLSLSYVGTFGHHLILNADGNPGDPALCLSLSNPSQVMPGTPTCGPGGENVTYYPASGGTVRGTRTLLGSNFRGFGYQLDIGNSAYNSFESTLRHVSNRLSLLVGYTFSKALDNGSTFGDAAVLQTDGSIRTFKGLSNFDMTHNLVFSYAYELPFDRLFGKENRATRGWRLSGVAHFATGLPVLINEFDDQSLLGSTRNSPTGGVPDTPNYTAGDIFGGGADRNPRDGKPYFNVNLFTQEPLGQLGTARHTFFHGPGMNNWDLALLKDLKLTESKSLEFRAEFFNAFNHAQFYGLYSVDGAWDDGLPSQGGTFGLVTGAAPGRIGQLGIKFLF